MNTARHRRRLAVVLSCEHGGNEIPARYRRLFSGEAARTALNSHRGWDPGSLEIARALQRQLNAPLITTKTSRLLVEPNRSLGHRQLFSEWTQRLSESERHTLLEQYYHPHRNRVVATITAAQAAGHCVLHLSIHTFTPLWDGQPRPTDIGLLYDPRRELELAFCRRWQRQLQAALPDETIHRNRPYRGTSDGLTTALRRQFPPSRYLGIELEVNQRHSSRESPTRHPLHTMLANTLRDALHVLTEAN